MMTEELATAGLPAEPEVQDHEIAQPLEEHTSPAASGSGIHKDGEARSEEEDVGNVDVDVKELIAVRQSRPLPPSFVFGESKVTANLIREYEAARFFPAGEVVVFRDFSTCGLRFPCDPILPAILNAFSVKIHQLSLNSFLEVSRFIWIMKTFGCNFGADVFA
jgi:hypothetical protein